VACGGLEAVIRERAVGLSSRSGRISPNEILHSFLDVGPVLFEPGIVRMVQGLAISLEHGAAVAVGEGTLAGRMGRRRHFGSVIDPAIRILLVLEVDPTHLALKLREHARCVTHIAPDVGSVSVRRTCSGTKPTCEPKTAPDSR
jgi:hypothetical protein